MNVSVLYAAKDSGLKSASIITLGGHGDGPNNSFNRSANSIDFMRETSLVIMVRRARLIRALDIFVECEGFYA